MAISNHEIAGMFNELADLLEIEGDNPFRVRAYRNAALLIQGLPQNIADMVSGGEDLTELPGIGKELAAKIRTIVETGTLPQLRKVERQTPQSLRDLLRIRGLGPKRVHALFHELKVHDLKSLHLALDKGRVGKLAGFGAKTEALIRDQLPRLETEERRMRLADAEAVVAALRGFVATIAGVKEVTVAGSYRRRRETVGDLDILVSCTRDSPVADRITRYGEVAEVLSHGPTRSTVKLRSGLQVDVRIVPQVSYGAALQYFTGSKAHNVALRRRAQRLGLKINEYGVFRGTRRIAGRSERDVYRAVDLPYIEPELRENRGEIEAAEAGALPRLLLPRDIRGDLHTHSNATDGHHSLREMALAGQALGYQYLAVTDHSRRVTMAHGLDEKRLREQLTEIDRLNEELNGLTLLKGCEVDILEDGSLDLPDSVLRELDLTVCSVHYHFNLTRGRQTERILRAMDDPSFTVLGHPSGRLINEREAYAVDMERIVSGAAERGCYLEVNAQPSRLDLNDLHCQLAKAHGVKLAVCSDAHSTGDLQRLRFGIDQARRGWLEMGDIINTRSLSALRRLLQR